MEHAVVVLMALLLNAVLAGPRQLYVMVGLAPYSRVPVHMVRQAERKLNRNHRSLGERQGRGTLLAIAAVLASIVIGWIGEHVFRHNLGFIELLIVTIALPVRPTWDTVWHIRKALQTNDLTSARHALAHTAWRHHALLDDYGIARAGIEMLAVHFAEKIVAPALWYLWLGLPGLLISKSIYLLQEVLINEPAFGKAARYADYLWHYIPSRAAAVLWIAAAPFLSSVNMKEAAKQIMRGLGRKSPSALALLAMASVLKLSLGGPTSIYANDAWIGAGTPKPTASDVKRALMFFALLHLLLFIVLGVFL